LKVKGDPEFSVVMEVTAHPLPSGAIPRLVVVMPVLVIVNVGVLVPSRFTVNAARLELPDPQFPTRIPVPAVGVLTVRVAQFALVAKLTGGTVTDGKTWDIEA
jgi:hypothetical protein